MTKPRHMPTFAKARRRSDNKRETLCQQRLRIESLVMKCVAVLICIIWNASAVELPAGTPIAIRLKSKIASNASKPHDPIEAVVIQPVMAGDQFVIPYGAVLRGQVDKAQSAAAADQRADR